MFLNCPSAVFDFKFPLAMVLIFAHGLYISHSLFSFPSFSSFSPVLLSSSFKHRKRVPAVSVGASLPSFSHTCVMFVGHVQQRALYQKWDKGSKFPRAGGAQLLVL